MKVPNDPRSCNIISYKSPYLFRFETMFPYKQGLAFSLLYQDSIKSYRTIKYIFFISKYITLTRTFKTSFCIKETDFEPFKLQNLFSITNSLVRRVAVWLIMQMFSSHTGKVWIKLEGQVFRARCTDPKNRFASVRDEPATVLFGFS